MFLSVLTIVASSQVVDLTPVQGGLLEAVLQHARQGEGEEDFITEEVVIAVVKVAQTEVDVMVRQGGRELVIAVQLRDAPPHILYLDVLRHLQGVVHVLVRDFFGLLSLLYRFFGFCHPGNRTCTLIYDRLE